MANAIQNLKINWYESQSILIVKRTGLIFQGITICSEEENKLRNPNTIDDPNLKQEEIRLTFFALR